mmetsp:Transcript_18773/g.61302  ORF Transcript_18773/g.61302 Transcript_18773/m.61302 type:complete len:364 (-) Transcript_18773:791-1882(-)
MILGFNVVGVFDVQQQRRWYRFVCVLISHGSLVSFALERRLREHGELYRLFAAQERARPPPGPHVRVGRVRGVEPVLAERPAREHRCDQELRLRLVPERLDRRAVRLVRARLVDELQERRVRLRARELFERAQQRLRGCGCVARGRGGRRSRSQRAHVALRHRRSGAVPSPGLRVPLVEVAREGEVAARPRVEAVAHDWVEQLRPRLFVKHHRRLTRNVSPAEKQNAMRRLAVAAGTPRLLVVVLHRFAERVVDHKAHVRFVDAHTECDGGHHHLHFAFGPALVGLHARFIGKVGVVKRRRDASSAELRRDRLRIFAREGVDNPARARGRVRVMDEACDGVDDACGGGRLFHNGVGEVWPMDG